mmetsp:Transcript_23958/g.52401  ORF Transcript_23958/g.52401 Transcript_23958/m.52401 type:complete len:209 (-) Transcript_23958:554-1180(-)
MPPCCFTARIPSYGPPCRDPHAWPGLLQLSELPKNRSRGIIPIRIRILLGQPCLLRNWTRFHPARGGFLYSDHPVAAAKTTDGIRLRRRDDEMFLKNDFPWMMYPPVGVMLLLVLLIPFPNHPTRKNSPSPRRSVKTPIKSFPSLRGPGFKPIGNRRPSGSGPIRLLCETTNKIGILPRCIPKPRKVSFPDLEDVSRRPSMARSWEWI